MSIRDELTDSLGRPPAEVEYQDEQDRRRACCEVTGHPLKRLSRLRAYPALGGTCCTYCETIELEW